METQPKSRAEYRTASLKIFAGKHTAEHQWLIDEVVQKLEQGETELAIGQELVRNGATGENGVLQVARDIYWKRIFTVANEDLALGQDHSPAITRSKEQALALVTIDGSLNNLRWRLEKAGCSKELAQRLAHDPEVLKAARQVTSRELWIGIACVTFGIVAAIYLYDPDSPNVMPMVVIALGGLGAVRSAVRLLASRR